MSRGGHKEFTWVYHVTFNRSIFFTGFKTWWLGEGGEVSMGGIVLVKGMKGSPSIECLSANVTITAFSLTAASHTCALRGKARIPRHAR